MQIPPRSAKHVSTADSGDSVVIQHHALRMECQILLNFIQSSFCWHQQSRKQHEATCRQTYLTEQTTRCTSSTVDKFSRNLEAQLPRKRGTCGCGAVVLLPSFASCRKGVHRMFKPACCGEEGLTMSNMDQSQHSCLYIQDRYIDTR